MERLLHYVATIYDANCIILYCFYCEVPRKDGSSCLVQENDSLTPLVRAITQKLIDSGKRIKILRIIINEVRDPVLASAVRRRVNESGLRKKMGLAHLEPFPRDLELQILEKCRKTAKKIMAKSWVEVEDFQPEQPKLDALRAFYKRIPTDPSLRGRLSTQKDPMPSMPDLHLMAYSETSGLPILTNDSHFTAFHAELAALNHVAEIVPLTSVKL